MGMTFSLTDHSDRWTRIASEHALCYPWMANQPAEVTIMKTIKGMQRNPDLSGFAG